MKYYIFSNVETGQVWSVKGNSFEEAEEGLPEGAQWDDWFEI